MNQVVSRKMIESVTKLKLGSVVVFLKCNGDRIVKEFHVRATGVANNKVTNNYGANMDVAMYVLAMTDAGYNAWTEYRPTNPDYSHMFSKVWQLVARQYTLAMAKGSTEPQSLFDYECKFNKYIGESRAIDLSVIAALDSWLSGLSGAEQSVLAMGDSDKAFEIVLTSPDPEKIGKMLYQVWEDLL